MFVVAGDKESWAVHCKCVCGLWCVCVCESVVCGACAWVCGLWCVCVGVWFVVRVRGCVVCVVCAWVCV